MRELEGRESKGIARGKVLEFWMRSVAAHIKWSNFLNFSELCNRDGESVMEGVFLAVGVRWLFFLSYFLYRSLNSLE